MNRNAESRFAINPINIDIKRSQFNRPSRVLTTFNAGDIVPFYVDEVLPGSTFNVKSSKVIRMPALKTPLMDNIYLDTYYFYVPNRLVWKHWKEFFGENSESAWIPETTYEIPQIVATTDREADAFGIHSVADYMGVPPQRAVSVSALPFRCYALICNEFFRDQNLTDPLVISTGDENVNIADVIDDITDLEKPALGLSCFKASKYHDLFTSSLPGPQKGPDVTIGALDQSVPVFPGDAFDVRSMTDDPMTFVDYTKAAPQGSAGFSSASGHEGQLSVTGSSTTSYEQAIYPNNLHADTSGMSLVSINQLRLAFQIQKFYERAARGGTRYTEMLKSFFGVTAPDASLQRPEYLGGNRIPISVTQVINQTDDITEGSRPLGSLGATSLTTDRNNDFIKSFTEHGFVIGVMVARYDHTYQEGLERMWSRKNLFDFYNPLFANIGEQAILNKEIYCGTADDEGVFGYQEAWAEYRYKPNRVCGFMRSMDSGSLDTWHLADDYASLPALSDEWIREDKTNLDRVLTVSSETSGFQFFADIFVRNTVTAPMPLYSVPGLIDHH